MVFAYERKEIKLTYCGLGEVPCARSSHVASRISGPRIFIHGGCDDSKDFSDAYTLDLRNAKLCSSLS